MDNVGYQPLPGRGFGPFRRDRLWMAEDHLLSIRSSRFVDVYERFYFRDIQGIYFRERRGEFFMIVAALALPCLGLLALCALHRAWLIPLAPLAAWTLAYATLGKQADCHIQTLIGLHAIPAIGRRVAYDHLLNRVVPLIEANQGMLDTAGIELFAPTASPYRPPPMEDPRRTKAPNRGWFFEAAFATVIAGGLFSMWNHRGAHGAFADWLEYALSLSALALMLVSLIRAYRVDVGGAALSCLWAIVGTQSVYSIGVGVFASIQSAAPRMPGAPRYGEQHPIRSLPTLLPYATAMEGLCVLLAVIGMLLILNRKNQQTA